MFPTRQSYEAILEASHHDLRNPDFRFDVLGAMNKVQDEETQGSGSGSGISDLSALENETDDFGRQLLQHQRDVHRLNNAIRPGQQPFRKARPHPRITERLEREQREREVSAGQDHQRVGSSGSNNADPAVTVPREWGRKARRQTDWMRKILEPSETGSELGEETLKSDEDAIYAHRTLLTGDLDGRDMGDNAVGSVEDTPPSMRRKRVVSSPSSMRHMNTTLGPGLDSEDQDFAGNSILASTPATKIPRRKIDELAREEIEMIGRQALTTRVLDQIDERLPNATLRRTSNFNHDANIDSDSVMTDPPPLGSTDYASENQKSPSKIPRRQQRLLINNKENVPVNSDAAVGATAGLVNWSREAVNLKNLTRPRHVRHDSMNLLKRLARVSSSSPSPGRDKQAPTAMELRAKSDKIADSRPRSADEDDHSKKPVDEANAKAGPEGALEELNSAPMPHDAHSDAKTPVVAGAWVDTTLNAGPASPPKTTVQETESNQEAVNVDNLLRVRSEPVNPKSALEAIMREAKDGQDSQQFGESTIQSLEDIAHPDMDPTDPTLTFDFATLKDSGDKLDDSRPLTQAEKDRRQEGLAMEAMNKHLRAARTSIKDANRGLRRVENRIETVEEDPDLVPTNGAVVVAKSRKHGWHECEACGGSYNSVWKALWAEFRSCFYVYDRAGKFGIHFTFLGLCCLYWLIWYIAENILCNIYCHPLYSSTWVPVIWNAPRYPFVIPTLIFRPFRPLWGPGWDAMMEFLEAWFHDNFAEVFDVPMAPIVVPKAHTIRHMYTSTRAGSSQWVATAAATSVRAAQSVVDAVDEIGSMWDDEWVP